MSTKRKSAAIWDYYEKQSLEKAKCIKCSEILSTKDYNTSGLIRHLRQHSDLMQKYDQIEERKKAKVVESTQQQAKIDTFVVVSSFV